MELEFETEKLDLLIQQESQPGELKQQGQPKDGEDGDDTIRISISKDFEWTDNFIAVSC